MGRVFVVWLQLILLPALYGAKKKGEERVYSGIFHTGK